MAAYTLNAGDIGAYEKTLVASTVDTVTFPRAVDTVEVYTDGTAAVYFTVTGTDPTVAGATTLIVPASSMGSVRRVRVGRRDAGSVVKVISLGTPKYSVAEMVA